MNTKTQKEKDLKNQEENHPESELGSKTEESFLSKACLGTLDLLIAGWIIEINLAISNSSDILGLLIVLILAPRLKVIFNIFK